MIAATDPQVSIYVIYFIYKHISLIYVVILVCLNVIKHYFCKIHFKEFIPSGRQQALNHPGPVEPLSKKQDYVADDFLLQDFEKVSIVDVTSSEWWILRKTPNLFELDDTTVYSDKYQNGESFMLPETTKSHMGDILDDSWSSKSADTNFSQKKRTSGLFQKRFSNAFDRFGHRKFSTGNLYQQLNLLFFHDVFFAANTEPLTCKSTLGFMEEELYVKGNMVIWSKGLSYNKDDDSTREIVCSYSSTYPVKHALWCNFFCERPSIESSLVATEYKPNEPLADPISCVSIIDCQNLKVFTVDNEDFVTSLPFQVSRVWNIKVGILLERDISGMFQILLLVQ